MGDRMSNKYDLLCALSLVTGRQLPELLKGRFTTTDHPFELHMIDGVVRVQEEFTFDVLLAADVILYQVARLNTHNCVSFLPWPTLANCAIA